MREGIGKFRVWCKNKNEWETDRCLLGTDGVLYHQNRQMFIQPLNPDTHIVEFFTGLQDKNGKDVYEGDVAQVIGTDFYGEIKRLEGGAFYVDHQEASLKYLHQVHCEVCEATNQVSLLSHFDAYEIDVTGTIHDEESK